MSKGTAIVLLGLGCIVGAAFLTAWKLGLAALGAALFWIGRRL